MIQFNNVTKVYQSGDKEVKAVNRVNLSVEKGEICVLIGPSGCGKTTLLRMVNRMIEATEGLIEVNGENIQSLDSIQLRRSIGYVIQQTGLFPNMTIEQNVSVVPRLLGWDRVKIQHRYNELMDMMGLDPDEYRNRYPWELSGGQQQRIGVARALAADPPVMLMDEPFGALDPVIREHLQNEFLRIQKTVKKTILFVSHDIDEAIRLGDAIAIFNAGELMQYGTPNEILSNPRNEFVSQFVGSDRTLKRLNLLTVDDLLQRVAAVRQKKQKSYKEACGGSTVRRDSDLRNALSVLLSSPTGAAAVVDEEGNAFGNITIADFERLVEVHPAQLKSIVQ
ncbi:osmoprotectant transport system ATP-binding protein [Melghirimyces profundicolus]|uniref:Carnitine transport ATP-binding protein OpuCA n=1 Tax=Melghirimyces profundicolus TaxID=1242148 RepID=A0A2T6C7U5_9BACL|nr:ABC transporter ATP-binding protein [Melghirimyces profundicolus]PTX64399.1 osmoprotectant transport system ATP-binding protein [Melghirimyces profundicolus]